MGNTLNTYTSTCHVVVGGKHVWPDEKVHKDLGRTTRVELSEEDAKPYGDGLRLLAPAATEAKDAKPTHDKQITETARK